MLVAKYSEGFELRLQAENATTDCFALPAYRIAGICHLREYPLILTMNRAALCCTITKPRAKRVRIDQQFCVL